MVYKIFTNEKRIIFLYSFFCLLFLLITNNYFDENNINQSATSGIYYLDIAKSFPNTFKVENDSNTYIHADRFIISYLMGGISLLINIPAFEIFFIFSKICIIFFIYINYLIIIKFKVPVISKLLLTSLILLNPYIIRYFLANPLMLNDLIFYISISLLLLSFQISNNLIFYISIILALFSRQTSIIILIAFIITYFFPKNNFINTKKIFYILIFFAINFILSKIYISEASLNNFYHQNLNGLLYYLLQKFDFLELINFLFYPAFSFFPLIIFLSLEFIYNKPSVSKNFNFIIFFLILGIFLQPILGGPHITGKNIIRLTSYAYMPVIYTFYNLYIFQKSFNKKFFFIFILFLFFWSLHPTFSRFSFFN